MIEITALDTIPLILLGLVAPVYSIRSFRKLQKRLAAGGTGLRVTSYLETIVVEWGMLALVLAIWLLEGRELLALGFGVTPTTGLLVVTAISLAAIGHSIYEVSLAKRDAGFREEFRLLTKDLTDFMPQTRRELKTFYALSATAGICEEVVYRGYLMAVFAALGGPILAVIGSTVLFTLGHTYQPATIHRVAAFGLATSLLYLFSGSLLPVIALHIGVDMTSGTIAYLTFSESDSSDGVTEAVG